MKIEIKDPNYSVGQQVKFNCTIISMVINVEITKVILVFNVETKEFEYRYDFKHNIKDGWTWNGVDEETLDYDNKCC